MRKFLFDVDGTLTPSRKLIDSEFGEFFSDICRTNSVYIVTGSDRSKTLEQLGSSILNSVQLLFNCSGNEVWDGENLIYKSDWVIPEKVNDFLLSYLASSPYLNKTGAHIEHRNGSTNFSILGRNGNDDDRQDYIKWDKSHNERYRLAKQINDKFPAVSAFVGGETGIDIFERGKDKQQVIDKIKEDGDILYFFGDQIFENGNDYNVAMECDHHYKVKSWSDTQEILKYFSEVGMLA